MIIFDINNEKINISLSDLGIDVHNAFKYDRTNGTDEFALDLPFANPDKVTELFNDSVEMFAMENGYYGEELIDKAIEYKSIIEFVYSFDSDTSEIGIWIEPINKSDTEFLYDDMSVTWLKAELDEADRKYLCMCLAEIIYFIDTNG